MIELKLNESNGEEDSHLFKLAAREFIRKYENFVTSSKIV
jgi:hypothetical protein